MLHPPPAPAEPGFVMIIWRGVTELALNQAWIEKSPCRRSKAVSLRVRRAYEPASPGSFSACPLLPVPKVAPPFNVKSRAFPEPSRPLPSKGQHPMSPAAVAPEHVPLVAPPPPLLPLLEHGVVPALTQTLSKAGP